MPQPQDILQNLTAIANSGKVLAVGWHVVLAALVVGLIVRPRQSRRRLAAVLVAPLVTVGVVAWTSGNWFNGAAFGLLSAVAAGLVVQMTGAPLDRPSPLGLSSGVLLLGFGLFYPHFVHVDHWTEYAIAAPVGLLPCPTLAAVSGLTLLSGLWKDRRWTAAIAIAGLFYGAVGVFRLGVALDVGLLAGAVILAGASLRRPA